jgi:hypothetical protein
MCKIDYQLDLLKRIDVARAHNALRRTRCHPYVPRLD